MRSVARSIVFASTAIVGLLLSGHSDGLASTDDAGAPHTAPDSPVLSPARSMASYHLPTGYRLELVAAEPLVQDPVAIDFDADGRMYVVEMRAFMPNLAGTGEDRPIGRIVVLEDTNDDGKMDKKTVFIDSLVLPRSIKVLERGVLIAETPNLWLATDTNGDLKADRKVLVRNDYGTTTSNPEHNANGLVWGLDNWIHNSNWAGELRARKDSFEYRTTPSQGQWGLSMDRYGRFYRNSNEDPLHVDLIPEHYAGRTPASGSMRGLYERLVPNVDVWPAHATPAVNRGYQPSVLRADGRLAKYTSASSPTIYVGDRLPEEIRSSVFVTEPAGNLIGRLHITEDSAGLVTARNGDEHPSFFASTDTRSRPVSMATAPDGTLYIVDMYRGIIQHRVFVTGYLEEQIKEHKLEQPVGLGRIYRLVHTSTKRGPRPHLSRATSAQLVANLSHPNGWWRITSQRLLVERGDKSVVPALKQLATSGSTDVARLHALWTLDGLDAVDDASLRSALVDASPHVRAAAVRIAEPRLRQAADSTGMSALMQLINDPTPAVRRQLAASLGELPRGQRETALLAITNVAGRDPVVADLVISALPGRERAFLERVLAASNGAQMGPSVTVQALAASVFRQRDTAGVSLLVALVTDNARPVWQRQALADGMAPGGQPGGGGRAGGRGAPPGAEGAEGAPAGGRGAGGGGFGRGGAGVMLSAPPAVLLALAQSGDSEMSDRARRLAAVLDWPGKPRPAAPPPYVLTADEERRFADGRTLFTGICAGCHQANGEGRVGVAKSLVGSRWALSIAPQVIRILLHGKEGEMLMPPVGASMTNEQIAAVLTYVRRSWGNSGLPISVADVQEARGATAGRKRAWTETELATIRR